MQMSGVTATCIVASACTYNTYLDIQYVYRQVMMMSEGTRLRQLGVGRSGALCAAFT